MVYLSEYGPEGIVEVIRSGEQQSPLRCLEHQRGRMGWIVAAESHFRI